MALKRVPNHVKSVAAGTDPLDVRAGLPIPAVERIKIFSPEQWEDFISEWATSLTGYASVERAGGAGDMGCDVLCTVDPDVPAGPWDNYQCKRYDHPLAPDDIWIELAKVCYYTFVGEYALPRHYYFVAPRGLGMKLLRALQKPQQLKADLLKHWPDKCSGRIAKGKQIPIDAVLRAHIEAIDFSMFRHVPVLTLIEGHARTRYHAARFGGGLRARGAAPKPPTEIASVEIRYVQQLLDAYGDNLKTAIGDPARLTGVHHRHFVRARESFYCAEALRTFSRDNLPEGAFEGLQQQIHDGVIDVCEGSHACGFTRVKATTDKASVLELTSSALLGRVETVDRFGICHQLANEDRLTWVAEK
jgi:hypothetical protein